MWEVSCIFIYTSQILSTIKHGGLLTWSTVTEAGPSAFATIQENYYYVFVGCSLFFLVVAYLYFPLVILFLWLMICVPES